MICEHDHISNQCTLVIYVKDGKLLDNLVSKVTGYPVKHQAGFCTDVYNPIERGNVMDNFLVF